MWNRPYAYLYLIEQMGNNLLQGEFRILRLMTIRKKRPNAMGIGLIVVLCLTSSRLAAGGQEGSRSPINYSTLQLISPGDSDAVIAEKAAKVLPRPNQTTWMRYEKTFFLHFGPNTFRGVEWGNGREDPSIFNPTQLDAEQWVRAVKDAGGKEIILVCKHHDGFALWPTRYTNHSVAASPWREGKGNEVREVAEAARKYGVKLGVYLSPADLYQLRTNPTNPDGYYGDGSEKRSSAIPTDPASFKSDPSKRRAAAPGFRNYSYDVDDYNRYFMNQLYELLTEYGPVVEVWFDGANPDPSVHETYDYAAWYDLIRKLQPNAVISCKGPDVRWVGNENGIGRTTEWSVIPLPQEPDTFRWPDMTAIDLGSRSKLTPGSYLWWDPAQVNNPILYGWFWAPKKRVRTAAELIDIYYESVGRNGNWLLNLSPDTRGLIPDNQLASLHLATEAIDKTFSRNLAAGGRLSADSSNRAHRPSLARDGDLDTWWEAAAGQSTAALTLKMPHAVTFDVVSLQEAVDHRSQRIESFAVDVWDGSNWKTMEQQTTVGHKRLLRWDAPVTTDQVRIRITGSRMEPTLAEIGLFKQAEVVPPPIVSDRDSSGSVTIDNPKGLPVAYTLDGTMPTSKSAVYHSPITMPRGGRLQAAYLTPGGKLGMLATKYFTGLSPIGWKIVSADSQDPSRPAASAIDGNSATIWQTAPGSNPQTTHEITVDMEKVERIAGFTYLPRQDGVREGIVQSYRFETSVDGLNWRMDVDAGRFGNVGNNPILQEIPFAPIDARFFRFISLQSADSRASAAEISVIPADGGNP